jgi:hypothetical protein
LRVVYYDTMGDAVVNWAACFARAAGGSDACGKAVDAWYDCYAQVCAATPCGSDAAVTACYDSQRAADACAAYAPQDACGGATNFNALNNVCTTYTDVARVVCSK